MGGKWRIFSHPTGPWVVNAGGRRMIMPEVPARALVPLEGRRPGSDDVFQCLQAGNKADAAGWSQERICQVWKYLTERSEISSATHSRHSLWLRIPLVSARGVRILARPVEVLTKGWVQVGLMIFGAVVPLLPLAREGAGSPDTGIWLAAAGLFLLGAMLHELGHAAALSHQGYPAGGIGAGLLFVIPVLHNDVSAISQLPTRGKLRVDLAGVALQVTYGALLLLVTDGLAGLIAARMTYFAVGWSLIPFIRADGYWALCDVMGFRDLERPFEGPSQRWRLVFLLVHRVLNIVFLGLVAVLLPVMWADKLTAIVPPWSSPLASVLIPGLVLLLWGIMGRRIYILIGLLVGDLRRQF